MCLFNVTADPCELNNLAFDFPTVIRVMEDVINKYNATAVPPGNKPIDPRADPKQVNICRLVQACSFMVIFSPQVLGLHLDKLDGLC